MKLDKLNLEQLFKLRSDMILEGKKDLNQINLLIEKKENEYSQSIILK